MQFTMTVRALPDLSDAEIGRLPFVVTAAIGHAVRGLIGVVDVVVTLDDPPARLTAAAAAAVSGLPLASILRFIELGELPPSGHIQPADLDALRARYDGPREPM